MTLKYLAGNKITGVAADTKPTTVPEGSFFTETDTKKEFILLSGVWTASGVGASIEGSEITAGSIDITKLSTGTPNKTLGYDNSGNPAELAGSSGVSPTDTALIVAHDTTYNKYERPLFIKTGKDNDLTKTPKERFEAEGNYSLTFEEKFSPTNAAWQHNGSTAYAAQSGLHLHTDYQSASTLDLRKFIGTPEAPIALSTDAWVLRFRFIWTDKAPNDTYYGNMMFGISSKDNTVFSNQAQCFVGFNIRGRADTTYQNYLGSTHGGSIPKDSVTQNNTNFNDKDISYVEICRQGGVYKMRLYADEHYNKMIHEYQGTDAGNYHNQQRDDTYTGTDSNQELKYLKAMGYCTNTAEKNYIQGKVDNIKFWNGFAEAPEVANQIDMDRPNDMYTENYYSSGKPRFGNPDTNNNIGDTAPNNTVFTRNNKWYDVWTDELTYTEPMQVDTGSSQDGHLATNSSYPPSMRIDTVSSGNFGIGWYIDSVDHPLVQNSTHQFNQGWHKGNGVYGKVLKNISVWLWKDEETAGNLTGNLVMRVFNAGGNMNNHHRFTSHNYVDIATLSSVESVGSKITFDMTGYAPRNGDYIFVECETTNATNAPNPNLPTYYKSTGAFVGNNETHLEAGFDSNNTIHMVSRYIEDNDLSHAARHYNSTSVAEITNWRVKFEAELFSRMTTKKQDYPIIDVFCGYPKEDKDRRAAANNNNYQDITDDGKFQENNWSWFGSGTWGTDTNPEHFYYKRRADGTATTQYLVDMRTEYNRRTNWKGSRKNTATANPVGRYWDFGKVDHRFLQVRVGSSRSFEVWVADTNIGDPYTVAGIALTGNTWRRISFDGEGTDYIYFNDRFRYLRVYVENDHFMDNSNNDFYYAYDMVDEQKSVTGLMLNPSTDMDETQFEIQSCNDEINENLNTEKEYTDTNNRWKTIRTINVSALTDDAPNYIRIPVSHTSRIRIKGKNLNKQLSFNQIKVLYKDPKKVDTEHGHITMSPTNAALNLDGSA